ncbi:MAG: hypothetical protein NWR22_14175, partial [Saprospiraceae bacterium]|nr:hypothetical protein [Saprospiraceae bacterium]
EKNSFVPILFISFLSCQKEENLIAPEVDERLTFFFESFIKEGSSRGQNINMEDIIGQIIDVETDGVLGRCNQLTSGEKHLMIDRLFWETANMTEKEYVIFHELGHCALNRRHLDATNKDGTCTSMMQSGNGSCKMVYNAQNRSKYLDELFSQ